MRLWLFRRFLIENFNRVLCVDVARSAPDGGSRDNVLHDRQGSGQVCGQDRCGSGDSDKGKLQESVVLADGRGAYFSRGK